MAQDPSIRFVMEEAGDQRYQLKDEVPEGLLTKEQADDLYETKGSIPEGVLTEDEADDLYAAKNSAALKSETHSTRKFNYATNTWPARAEGYAYDVAIGPMTPEPTGAQVDDVHEIVVD